MNATHPRVVVVRKNRLLVGATPDETGRPFEVIDPRELPGDVALVPLGAAPGGPALLEIDPAHSDDETFARLGMGNHDARFADVMMHLGRFEEPDRALVLRAIALAQWSAANRFCAECGAPLAWDPGAATKTCANAATPHRHFARTDPATIVLVSRDDRALLGRGANWPPGMYSTLAGFVEPGESAEAGVAREVFEETGVRVGDVRYAGSESWPFPRSLMLGFTATATTGDIVVGDELADARWFTRPEVAEMQRAVRERLPYFDTIARRLIANWMDGSS